MKNSIIWPVLCWLLLAPLAARAQAAQAAPPSVPPAPATASAKAAESPVEFHDELGRLVRVPVAPQRIVSLAPSLTETVFALELGGRLAGVTDYCDYPPEASTRARVGGPINPNLEQIVSLHPDVVLATRALNRPETVEALDRLGIPVYTTDPRTVDDVIASTRRLGKVLGAEARAEALATEMEQRMAELAKRLAGRAPRRVFFVVWTDPIITTGQHTFLADALRRAGAESVISASQDWPQISIEEVLRQNPEYLIFSGTHPDDPQSTINALRKRPGWSSLEAVRENRFAIISDAIDRPAPRLLDAIEDLARQLHPDAFQAAPTAAAARPGGWL
ncbi:MAG TPA: cobalamin-binding protein [Candidatus Acidoferrales bacterium]|nr:cobalamin-binding protein [Candidatus Acidoferrales bacterium]